MVKKKKEKPFTFQFYPEKWLSDGALKRCSFRAKGVWIDLICVAFSFEKQGVFCSNSGPLSEQEIIQLLTGKRSEARKGFKELVEQKVIKKLDDGSYYSKRLYEICRISRIRREAGLKGGNPQLLLNQNGNQTDNQNGNQKADQKSTPKSKSISIDKDILEVLKNNTSNISGQGLNLDDPKTVLDGLKIILEWYGRNSKAWGEFNPYQFTQYWLNRGAHYRAIWETIVELISRWAEIKSPWAYANKTVKQRSQNYHEADHIKRHEEFKQQWDIDPRIQSVLKGMFEDDE